MLPSLVKSLSITEELLLCDVNAGDGFQSGETPLHIAVRYCHFEVVKEFLTFINETKSRTDAVMLVNLRNQVRHSQ